MSGADWWPAAGILIAGLIAGGILYRSLSRRRDPSASEDLQYADLIARRDALIEQIRENPEAADRSGLEIEAARVLRDLDRYSDEGPRVSADPRPATRDSRPSDSFRGFLWGAGTVGVLALVVFLVTRSTSERGESGSLTGGGPPQGAMGGSDSELALLQQTVSQNPENIEARLDLAQALLAREQLMDVFEQTRFVLERQPENTRALSYQALVRLAMGQADLALQMLQKALSLDPNSMEARVHLALVYATTGNTAAAEEAIQETIRRHPAEATRLNALLQQIRSASATAADRIELLLELAPGKQVPANALLFVVARPAGVTEGAPIAVKRMPAGTFPVTVTLGPEDSMMGGKLTDKLRIEARIDSDGDALSRSPSDPSAVLDNVALGSSAVRLILR